MFTAPRGGPIREHKRMERYFKPAAVKAGLCVRTVCRGDKDVLVTDMRMQDLRHTAALLLIREGVSIKVLRKQLGQKDAVQTLNRHGPCTPTSSTPSPSALGPSSRGAVWRQKGTECGPSTPTDVVQIGKAAGQ